MARDIALRLSGRSSRMRAKGGSTIREMSFIVTAGSTVFARGGASFVPNARAGANSAIARLPARSSFVNIWKEARGARYA